MLRPMHEHMLRTDDDHAAALDILLLLADAEARWSNPERALDRLGLAEDAGYAVAPEYRLKRHLWDAALGG